MITNRYPLNFYHKIMSNLNKVMMMGTLTRDPEIKYTQSGMAVGNLGIAINRKTKRKDTNEYNEEVTFVDVKTFGKTAENIGKYFSKGKPIFIEGRLNLEQWEDKQSGQKRSKMNIIGESFQFIGGGKSQSSDQAPASQTASPATDDQDVSF